MMLRLRFLPVVALVLLSGCGYKWQDYESKEGNFSCRMPGKVKEQSQTQSMPGGTFTLHAHGVDLKNAAFMVGYADLPIKGQGFDYRACVNAMTSTWGGKVEYQKPVTVEGNTGVEFESKISKPADGWAAGRVFVHNNRVYQLIALGSKTRANSKEVQEFWNSFKLIKK